MYKIYVEKNPDRLTESCESCIIKEISNGPRRLAVCGAQGEFDMEEKKKITRRSESRELAFKLLFAKEFNSEADADAFYEEYLDITEEPGSSYAKRVFTGACASLGELDDMIEKAAENWRVSRMSVAARSVLRLAAYEMTAGEAPPKVVINEAVELSKRYDEEAAPSFVNGILNRIARERGLIEE